MSVFDCPPPDFTDAELAAIASAHFGRSGTLTRLESERDQNALLRAADGDFVLKIANGAEDRALLDLQRAALAHIAAADPGLPVPRVVPTIGGAPAAEVAGRSGTHQVRLLTFLRGRTLATDAAPFPELFERLGVFMGRLSRALQGFEHPAARRDGFLWALDHAARCRAFAGDIANADDRALVERLFDRYEQRVAPRLAFLRRSVTHQDANEYNILVDESDPTRIAGLIDFGDICLGRQVNELAVTLAYALLIAPEPLSAAAALIAGYAGVWPLHDDELEVLFDLVAIRLAMSVCISSHRSRQHPGHAYLLVSQRPAFQLLRRLEALDQAYARALFRSAARVVVPAEPIQQASAPDLLLARRRSALNPALSIAYRHPLEIVRGRGPYLYDRDGRRYLDCVNNIAHVGHCHPHVAAAIARQASLLNTNTRYLHDAIVELAERIAATLPAGLSVVTFVNSGTEANELALRMARAATGRKDVIVVDWAYHGNSAATVEISPYKFKRAGGFPKPAFVEIADLPDPYRGAHRAVGEDAGRAYARSVAACVERIRARTGHGPAAFIAESVAGVAGQVVYPRGYLEAAYAAVRAGGGLCIADEVQCGFGRVGEAFWAFQLQGVVPDIVVLGKPMGGGHPLGAVVTSPAVARAFANGMEYFNSFGGNPVSMAAGLAVMEVVEKEGLAANARDTGAFLLERLRDLAAGVDLIGDVRGAGFYLGVELVRNRRTLEPAREEANALVNILRNGGVLLSTDGPFDNVLKFKPPMTFRRREADIFIEALTAAFAALGTSAGGV